MAAAAAGTTSTSSSTTTATATTNAPAPTAAPPLITPSSLSQTLTDKLQATHTSIEDISGGCGQAFAATIVSPLFELKNTLARHRMVNGALRAEIAAIHAWTPRCFTPAEWASRGEGEGGGGGAAGS
ncbi:MAG: hypothetical protein M1826_000844 [Phylliscum demangeonii]|nr:MAG: hypothetical protein M1826_000844 [Phylliscum demangeonii]